MNIHRIQKLEFSIQDRNAGASAGTHRAARLSRFNVFPSRAFTLIELLVVIAIMALLAAMIFPMTGAIKKTQWKNTATAELNQIETALEGYKAKYGVYPPSNAYVYPSPMTNSLLPQLYYELSGVYPTILSGTLCYVTLDGSASIPSNSVATAFGVSGFLNCSKGSGEDANAARNFLLGLRKNQIGTVLNNGVPTTNIITSVRGPDALYMPLGTGYPEINPFRYVYPGVNNPNSYNLWVQLRMSNKTNLICNWTKAVTINSPLP